MVRLPRRWRLNKKGNAGARRANTVRTALTSSSEVIGDTASAEIGSSIANIATFHAVTFRNAAANNEIDAGVDGAAEAIPLHMWELTRSTPRSTPSSCKEWMSQNMGEKGPSQSPKHSNKRTHLQSSETEKRNLPVTLNPMLLTGEPRCLEMHLRR